MSVGMLIGSQHTVFHQVILMLTLILTLAAIPEPFGTAGTGRNMILSHELVDKQ
jgi:hypothetical protein